MQGQGACSWSPFYPPPFRNYWHSAYPNPTGFTPLCPMPAYSFNPAMTTDSHTAPTSSVQLSHAALVVSPVPFTLKMVTDRIRICQGFKKTFHPDSDNSPYNVVICQKECRPLKAQDGQTKTPSTPSNLHYHVSLHCIRDADPIFMPEELLIPDDICSCLTDTSTSLFSMLGLYDV